MPLLVEPRSCNSVECLALVAESLGEGCSWPTGQSELLSHLTSTWAVGFQTLGENTGRDPGRISTGSWADEGSQSSRREPELAISVHSFMGPRGRERNRWAGPDERSQCWRGGWEWPSMGTHSGMDESVVSYPKLH